MQKKMSIIKNIIGTIMIIAIFVFAYRIYKTYNFNEFVKAEYHLGISKFERDNQEKYSNTNSYKIESKNYNDAMIYKTVKVTPNTPYKVTCKIKTQNVESKNENTDSGAHICIADTTEKSDNVVGTSDWTNIEFYFNAKNREEVKIGFRLGSFEDEVLGTAWFSDMTMEVAIEDTSNEWNFLCLLFDNVDVNINGQNIQLQLTQIDKEDMNMCMRRFKNSIEELSKNKIKVNYEIMETKQPITTMSYDEENGYYVSAYDVKNVIDPYVKQGRYDHIFIAFRTGDMNKQGAIQVNDWIGLGSMEYRGIGFSNIRLPDDDHTYIYKYNSRINTFPEEVFIHEFLHTLERNAKEYGYERPELHDNKLYGYENKVLIGLKEWYQDYMNKEIKTSLGNIGLPPEIYTKKPTKTTDFVYSHKLDVFKEPENIIEELNNVVDRFIQLFSHAEQIENNI